MVLAVRVARAVFRPEEARGRARATKEAADTAVGGGGDFVVVAAVVRRRPGPGLWAWTARACVPLKSSPR